MRRAISTDATESSTHNSVVTTIGRVGLLSTLALLIIGTTPVMAQTAGTAFCTSALAGTIKNLFTVIQFGGPLIGGVVALGSVIAIPMTRRVDVKKELKELRNQAVIWGIIVAPLGTEILKFLLNNVVVGGTSCGF